MSFWLLLGVKARLLARSFGRRGPVASVVATGLLVLATSPVAVGLGVAAHRAVVRHGVDGVAAVLGLVHVGWLFSAFLFAAFAEGFEWRTLLRYPVRPQAVFWMNVLLAPLDVVGLFLLPPLVGAALAGGRLAGPGGAVGVAAAGLLTLLATGVVLQILLAALGRFLRREWSRAVAGLLFGLAFATPAVLARRQIEGDFRPRAFFDRAIDNTVTRARTLGRWSPTTAPSVMVAAGALERTPLVATGGLAAAALLLVAGAALGTRWAVAGALAGEAAEAGVRGVARRRGSGRFEGLLGAELATLVGRELRVWLRTPQVVVGLLVTPILVLFFFSQEGGHLGGVAGMRPFILPFFCLVSVFNLSANQFGLDREGLRMLLLLPVEPRLLVLGKNVASGIVVAAETAVTLVAGAVVARLPAGELLIAGLAVVATFPVVLVAGNALSVRYPWRMTFRIGGAPPGALASAFAQMAVIMVMGGLLAVPVAVERLGGRRGIAIAGLLAIGAVAWAVWALLLGRAGRAVVRRREHLLEALARPHETG